MAELSDHIRPILDKYAETGLAQRWEDAASFGDGGSALAFWVRDTSDAVNIVWLNNDGIRDITYLPTTGESMFNFIRLDNIATFELREGENVAAKLGIGVSGILVVLVLPRAPRGETFWVTSTEEEAQALRRFYAAVLQAYVAA